MSETKVPGIAAKRVVITDECRTIYGDVGAFNKAVFQLLKEYDAITRLRVEEKGVNYHLVLTVEDTKRKPTEAMPEPVVRESTIRPPPKTPRPKGLPPRDSVPERALPVTPPSTCLPPDDPKPSEAPLGKAQVCAPVDPPSERPPVDPPRKPNRPDPPGKVRILWELHPSCMWHYGCQKMHSAPMRIVRTTDDYTVLECGACGKRGRYPVGGSCVELCDEEASCLPPADPKPSDEGTFPTGGEA